MFNNFNVLTFTFAERIGVAIGAFLIKECFDTDNVDQTEVVISNFYATLPDSQVYSPLELTTITVAGTYSYYAENFVHMKFVNMTWESVMHSAMAPVGSVFHGNVDVTFENIVFKNMTSFFPIFYLEGAETIKFKNVSFVESTLMYATYFWNVDFHNIEIDNMLFQNMYIMEVSYAALITFPYTTGFTANNIVIDTVTFSNILSLFDFSAGTVQNTTVTNLSVTG